jgi:endoglucanase
MTRRSEAMLLILGCAGAGLGCAKDPDYGPGGDGMGGAGAPIPVDGTVVPVGPAMMGLHVMGNHIENGDGLNVHMRGVNRSGTEYQCAHGVGVFEGPSTLASIGVMASWKINAVRIPLNEACWLGINGVLPAFSGDNYKRAILAYVALLHLYHMVPILDLHWTGPGASPADRLQPMPNADHSPAFWADVATTFANDDGVVFELFNEPYPDRNRDSTTGWTCWRDGCTANQSVPMGQPTMTFQAAGMQSLVDAIRATGSRHLLLIGGLQYSNALSQWLTYKPLDTAANIAAAWHVYSFNSCNKPECWDAAPGTLAMTVPIVATEIGENSCSGAFIEPLMQWYDAHGIGYLAWTWNSWGSCVPPTPPAVQGGRPWALITDYVSGAPISGYAQAYHAHLTTF